MNQSRDRRGYYLRNVLIEEPLPRESLLEVIDNKRVLIENHKGIVEYGLDAISVKVRNGRIRVTGNHLELLCMSKDKVVITGCITSIQFCRGGK